MSTLVRKRSTVSSDHTADIVFRILQEEITDGRVQRLRRWANSPLTTFRVEMFRTTPSTSKLCAITRLCFRSCSIFQLSSRRSFSKRALKKYDRRIGVCIKSCREDAILKRMQMDCIFFGDFPELFVVQALSNCKQIGEHEVGHSAS